MTAKERDELLIEIDDFLRNGFTEKVLKTIEDYFDRLIAKTVKWLFGIIATTAVIVVVGIVIKLIFFE